MMHNSQAMTPSSRQAVGGTPTSSKPHVLAHGIPQPVPSGPSKFICVQSALWCTLSYYNN